MLITNVNYTNRHIILHITKTIVVYLNNAYVTVTNLKTIRLHITLLQTGHQITLRIKKTFIIVIIQKI